MAARTPGAGAGQRPVLRVCWAVAAVHLLAGDPLPLSRESIPVFREFIPAPNIQGGDSPSGTQAFEHGSTPAIGVGRRQTSWRRFSIPPTVPVSQKWSIGFLTVAA